MKGSHCPKGVVVGLILSKEGFSKSDKYYFFFENCIIFLKVLAMYSEVWQVGRSRNGLEST